MSSGLVQMLFDAGLIRTWYRHKSDGWILRSGAWSPFYVQLRPLASRPALLEAVGHAMGELVRARCPQVTKLVGIAFAGIPIAVSASLKSGIPAGYTRDIECSTKADGAGYGEHSAVEGEFRDGDVIALVDDVVTRLDAKRTALSVLHGEADRLQISMRCNDICVVVSRFQGTTADLETLGARIHALVDLTAGGVRDLAAALAPREFEVIEDYLRNPDRYQHSEIQRELRLQSPLESGHHPA